MFILRSSCISMLLIWMLALGPPQVYAASNAVLGGIGGINNGTLLGGDGTGAASIDLSSVDIALVKQARDTLTGNLVPDGTNVSSGQTLSFVLFVDNVSNITLFNTTMNDALNEAEFTYIPNSLETIEIASGSSIAAVWGNPWAALSDTIGAPNDRASCVDSGGPAGLDRITVGADPVQTNQQLDIPAQRLRAIRFQVQVN